MPDTPTGPFLPTPTGSAPAYKAWMGGPGAPAELPPIADNRASVSVALIARDSARTIGACLDSIRPYVRQIVVAVDESTSDDTRQIAIDHGADLTPTIQVSDWHECERHGRVRAQHFANARNQSFTYLDRSCEWLLWIDSDDILVGGENLAPLLATMRPEVDAVWLAYNYSPLQGGKLSTTMFDRERILRSDRDWQWQFRVHEVVSQPNVTSPKYVRVDDCRVEHQENLVRGADHASRNLLLLEIDLEEKPDDSRTVFYIGNQFFALGRWAEAAHWYERLCAGLGENPYELWQAYVYLSMAYEKVGALDDAFRAAFGALETNANHPEPYFRLAALYVATGEAEKAVTWTRLGQGAFRPVLPPSFAFSNPLDYSFNSRVTLANALLAQKKVKEARDEFAAAYSVWPDENIKKAVEDCTRKIDLADQGVALHRTFSMVEPESRARLWNDIVPIDHPVRSLRPVRDLIVPSLQQSSRTAPRIVFFCGRSLEEWGPSTPNDVGIGGSETAVVEIAKRFANDGWLVDVYAHPGRFEGRWDGVGYWEADRYTGATQCDVFVSWRQPNLPEDYKTGRTNLLWCHDLNHGPDAQMDAWDRVLGVSAWHESMLKRYYPTASTGWVPNGVDLSRFTKTRKKPFSAIYASSPDRGLDRLLRLWPHIVSGEPGAMLHIAYGFDTMDKMILRGHTHLADLKASILKQIEATPQVTFRGRMNQRDLAALYDQTTVSLYPSNFLEVGYISGLEAMAGGCIPVTSACGVLPETIGYGGVVVTGNPYGRAFGELFTNCARAAMAEANIMLVQSTAARERAKECTWDRSFEKWKEVLSGGLYVAPVEAASSVVNGQVMDAVLAGEASH